MTEQALRALLEELSIEEKVGQLCQIDMATFLADAASGTGPMAQFHLTEEQMLLCGSLICGGNADAEAFAGVQQTIREKAPHQIPPLIMSDVIHGMRTIFPIPLALGCTFDPAQAETMGHISAKEAAACGIHVTFAPMADVARDPRWGRCMESLGESSRVCAELSAAMVRGCRGGALTDEDTVATCCKHFAAYGLVEAGREYAPVDVSHMELFNTYLPPFKAALDAGCDMIMPAFTPIDRVPAIASRWLLQDVLRDRWQWQGTIISDWGSAGELIPHGLADDLSEAAQITFEAGMDMDMMSGAYLTSLTQLVKDGRIDQALLDASVLRILRLKNALGLFEKPCKCVSRAQQEKVCHEAGHRAAVLDAALHSCVLLKNEGALPLKQGMKVALVGDKAESHDLLGNWAAGGQLDETPTLLSRMAADSRITLCAPETADVIIAALGERSEDVGEACSKTKPCLTDEQAALLRAMKATGKPVVLVLLNGRPLILTDVLPLCGAVLEAWFPGSEGAEAIHQLLMGDAVPSGHLSMSFPRSIGQIPVHHDALSTGRPDLNGMNHYVSCYLDEKNEPLFPFGFGLSYTAFQVSDIRLSAEAVCGSDTAHASVTVTNIGGVNGETVIQLYGRVRHGAQMRPLRTLCGYKRIALAAGESCEVVFPVDRVMLADHDAEGSVCLPTGVCLLAVGEDSTAPFTAQFTALT